MSYPIHQQAKAAVCALALCASSLTLAADPLTDAIQGAYAPYRAALFKTNGDSQGQAQQALMQAQRAWSQLTAQFTTKPPAPYDRDPALAQSLAEVAQVYLQAADEINANQLKKAHDTLEEAREVIANLRHRNQVVVFSDHMNSYHEEMEHVISGGDTLLTQSNGMLRLTAKVGALDYLAQRLTHEAPVELTGNGEFSALVKAVQQSVGTLQSALIAQDPAAVKDALGKLKQPYSKLFLKFG